MEERLGGKLYFGWQGREALKYLAQYVFRIAISNSRIISLKNGTVSFKYKDSDTNIWKILTLDTEEFIRRFLQHVLPSGFVKVRYFGLFASSNRDILTIANELLGVKLASKLKKQKTNKRKVFKCRACNKEMNVALIIPRYASRSFSEGGYARCNNKAPPIESFFVSDFNFNRCA